jgi:hypothetical protein
MNAERLAFLDDLEADLTTTKSSRAVEVGSRPETTRYSKSLSRRIGILGATLAAGVSLFTLSTNAAYASPAQGVRPAVPFCGVPNPVPYSHSKACNLTLYYYHEYLSQSPAGPGGQRTCYNFWTTKVDMGCGADPGRFTKVCA